MKPTLAMLKPFRLGGLIVVVTTAVFLVWLIPGIRPLGGESVTFTVNQGEKRLVVARHLVESRLIRSRPHFLFLSYIKGRRLVAGTFTLSANASLNTVINTLSSRSLRDQSITIPEGWRREQIAEYLAGRGVDKSQFLVATQDLEGRLFPDTYFIQSRPNVSDVVGKMTANFHAKTDRLNLTPTQLILASIVEREAKKDSDRPLIAGIYQGRLDDGIRLEADPTVQYGRDSNSIEKGTPPDLFWGPITLRDYLGVDSPYNTYRHDGVPPGPIANPGLKSIEAVRNSEKTAFRYFFHTPDGQIITSKTIDEHNRNKLKFLGKK